MEALTLEIKTNAESATSGIANLSEGINGLKTALSGFNGNALVRFIDRVATAINRISVPAIERLTELTSAISGISGAGMRNVASAVGGARTGGRTSNPYKNYSSHLDNYVFRTNQIGSAINASNTTLGGAMTPMMRRVIGDAMLNEYVSMMQSEISRAVVGGRNLSGDAVMRMMGTGFDGYSASESARAFGANGIGEFDRSVVDACQNMEELNRLANTFDFNSAPIEVVNAFADALDRLNGVMRESVQGGANEIPWIDTRGDGRTIDAEFMRGAAFMNGGGGGNSAWAEEAERSLAEALGYTEEIRNDMGVAADEAERMTNALNGNGNGDGNVPPIPREFGQIAQTADEAATRTESACRSIRRSHNGLVKMIGRMVLRRIIFAAIRAITQGAKEGVTNVYQYSKKIGGSFASAMDSAKSSIMVMKNSLGTALAPAIQALIPVLQTVVGWVRTLSNAVAQFFALLNGSGSWTRATDYATEFAEAAGGAGGAASDWLADWDELNVMNQGGGGGGGGAATDFENMFEEVYTFDKDIRNLVSWVEEHAENIKDILAGAAAYLVTLLATGDKSLSLAVGGITLSYEAGKTIGYKSATGGEVQDFDRWLATIGVLGTTAAGASIGFRYVGGKGAVIGAALGLFVGIASLEIGIDKGAEIAYQESFWGDKKLTEEEVSRYVSSLFTIDVDAQVELISAVLNDADAARKKVNDALSPLQTELRLINLGIKTTTTGLLSKANGLVDAFNAQLDADKHVLETTLSIVDVTDESGISILEGGISLSESLSEAVTGIGKQISERIAAGIKLGEGDILDALVETLADVVEAYNIGRLKGEFSGNMETLRLSGGSVDSILTGFSDEYTRVEESVDEIVQESINTLYAQAAAFDVLRKKYSDPTSPLYDPILAEQYEDQYNTAIENANLLVETKAQKISDYMDEITGGTKETIIGLIKTNANLDNWSTTNSWNWEDNNPKMYRNTYGMSNPKNFDNAITKTLEEDLGLTSGVLAAAGISAYELIGSDRYIRMLLAEYEKDGIDINNPEVLSDINDFIREKFGDDVNAFDIVDEIMLDRRRIAQEENRRFTDGVMPLENELFWDSVSNGTNTSPNVILDWLLSNGVTDVQDISKEAWDEAYEVINEMLSSGMWGDAEEERLLDIFGDNGYFGKILQMVQEMFDYGFTGFPEFGNGSGWYFGNNRPLVPGGGILVASAGMSDVGMGGLKPDDIPPATVHSLATATTADVVEGINASMNNGTLASGFASVLENALVSVRSKMDTANAHLSNIERKNMVVNVGATSGLGRVSSVGQDLYNRVSGRV